MIIWTTGKKVAVALVVLTVLSLVGMMFLNYMPNPLFPYQQPEPDFDRVEVTTIPTADGIALFNSVVGADFTYDISELESFNLKFYGVNDKTPGTSLSDYMLTSYEEALKKEPLSLWKMQYNYSILNPEMNFTLRGYTQILMGQFILVLDGIGLTPYDMIMVTSSSYLMDYYSFMTQEK